MQIDISFKKAGRKKRHVSARKRIEGTAERPRLAIFRSTRHIYAQVIDDLQAKTLVATSDLAFAKTDAAADDAGKKVRAKQVGTAIAKACLAKGIDEGRVRPCWLQVPRPGLGARRRRPRGRSEVLTK